MRDVNMRTLAGKLYHLLCLEDRGTDECLLLTSKKLLFLWISLQTDFFVGVKDINLGKQLLLTLGNEV